jgi:hypothetical protein
LYKYYDAGCYSLFKISLLFITPLFFLFIASLVGLSSGSDYNAWKNVIILLFFTEIISLPLLYMLKPFYASIAVILFILSSIGLYFLVLYFSKQLFYNYIAIAIVPLILFVLVLKYLRYQLYNIWDVCYVIRKVKTKDYQYIKDENKLLSAVKVLYSKTLKYFVVKDENEI